MLFISFWNSASSRGAKLLQGIATMERQLRSPAAEQPASRNLQRKEAHLLQPGCVKWTKTAQDLSEGAGFRPAC